MAVSCYPCRVCGLPSTGVDTDVVSSECLLGSERRSSERVGDGVDHLPLIAGEVEARLGRLVDDG